LWGLLAGGTLTFAATGLAGLAILPRYLTVPAIALCPLAGYAVAGFATAPAGALRDRWRQGAYVAVLVGVAFLVVKHSSFTKLVNELRFIHHTHATVIATAGDPGLGTCGAVTLPTYRLVPDMRFALHDDRGRRVRARSDQNSAGHAVALFVVREDKAIKRFGQADGVSRSTNRRTAQDTRPISTHGFLQAYSRC
jgi:hypothetical protein